MPAPNTSTTPSTTTAPRWSDRRVTKDTGPSLCLSAKVAHMADAIRVMVEQGKKRAVASAFDWPGWDRSGKSEDEALEVLAAYRPRYAKVAKLAGLADQFRRAGDIAVVERLKGSGMTDFYGLSYKSAGPEHEPMSEAVCERKLALLRATWTYFDDVASRVSAELRAHREAFTAAIRDYNARGAPARTWTVQFVIRHSAYHMLDHAWEMEDRDLSGAS